MSDRAFEFLEEWIRENVSPEAYVDVRRDPQPKQLAKQCAHEAEVAGIPMDEIEEEVGDLESCLASAVDAVADTEVGRLASKGN
jgi:hypothetical protein